MRKSEAGLCSQAYASHPVCSFYTFTKEGGASSQYICTLLDATIDDVIHQPKTNVCGLDDPPLLAENAPVWNGNNWAVGCMFERGPFDVTDKATPTRRTCSVYCSLNQTCQAYHWFAPSFCAFFFEPSLNKEEAFVTPARNCGCMCSGWWNSTHRM
ncbi:hypothetical protein BV898_17067 [Hypsibius exemplaris]|uniref:Apple domain-containing protein n=1 Tax=Hypsibius exemplaris TaxID=2072580 RepID=A0A9X6NG41_HYPEX|nr:hypothetical protein BV898_17067 [Hypsibius exemplaris]